MAAGTLGASEAHRIRKKIVTTVKKHPQEIGMGAGLLFGAPMLGASIGSAFGQAREAYAGNGSIPEFPAPGEFSTSEFDSSTQQIARAGMPPLNPLVLFGGGALLLVLLLKK